MTEKQVADLFVRYDVRALPVINDDNEVIGLVSYKEVTAAKQRLLNKQEKRVRQLERAAEMGKPLPDNRPLESALKGWMKQHVQIVEASTTMSEVEQILFDTDGKSTLHHYWLSLRISNNSVFSGLHTSCRGQYEASNRHGNTDRFITTA